MFYSGDHLFDTYAEFSEDKDFLQPDTHTYLGVSEGGGGLRNVNFSENFCEFTK